MKHGFRATASGVKHFFSFGGTNAMVNKGNKMLHGNEAAAKKAKVISALFVCLAVRSTPVGLLGNTLSSIKHGRKRYKEMKTQQPQLQQVLTAMGISPQGSAQIMQAVRSGDASQLNLSQHDFDLIAGGIEQIAQQADAMGIPAADVIYALQVVTEDQGTGQVTLP